MQCSTDLQVRNIRSLSLDEPTVDALVDHLFGYIAAAIQLLSDIDVISTRSCTRLMVSAFRAYDFVTSATTHPKVLSHKEHFGDLLVEVLAVAHIVRRTYVMCKWQFSFGVWQSKLKNPFPATHDVWEVLAERILTRWQADVLTAAVSLQESAPTVRRDFGAQWGSAHFFRALVTEPPAAVRQIWDGARWFSSREPPAGFAIVVTVPFRDLQAVEVELARLAVQGHFPTDSPSIVDVMLHIVLSSLLPLYAANGVADNVVKDLHFASVSDFAPTLLAQLAESSYTRPSIPPVAGWGTSSAVEPSVTGPSDSVPPPRRLSLRRTLSPGPDLGDIVFDEMDSDLDDGFLFHKRPRVPALGTGHRNEDDEDFFGVKPRLPGVDKSAYHAPEKRAEVDGVSLKELDANKPPGVDAMDVDKPDENANVEKPVDGISTAKLVDDNPAEKAVENLNIQRPMENPNFEPGHEHQDQPGGADVEMPTGGQDSNPDGQVEGQPGGSANEDVEDGAQADQVQESTSAQEETTAKRQRVAVVKFGAEDPKPPARKKPRTAKDTAENDVAPVAGTLPLILAA